MCSHVASHNPISPKNLLRTVSRIQQSRTERLEEEYYLYSHALASNEGTCSCFHSKALFLKGYLLCKDQTPLHMRMSQYPAMTACSWAAQITQAGEMLAGNC